jgi:hypothetical protein
MTEQEFLDFVSDKLEANFPKGKCKERGQAIVLIAEIKIELAKKGLLSA